MTSRPDNSPPPASASRRRAARWEALGTSVVLQVDDQRGLGAARAAVERELAAIDLACSRFRDDSELVRVNAARGREVAVGALLLEALAVALEAAAATDGDVDPTLGRALELAGYDRDWSLLRDPTPGQREASQHARVTVRSRAGWERVRLDRRRGTVRLPRGVALDLGATAKAWAADRAAAAAALASGSGVILAVGGDIATAGPCPHEGWLVRVTEDHRAGAGAPGQTITIRGGGLATSSTTTRRWAHAGRSMQHILDPRSGAPARGGWRTVSVAAADCTAANAAATAAIVRGAAAHGWLESLKLPARLVDERGRISCIAGWPAAGTLVERAAA